MRLILGLTFTSLGMAFGAVMSIMSASAVAVSAAQISVGSDTPVHGVTVGLMAAGLFAGVGMVVTGGRYLLRLGGDMQRWREGLENAAKLATLVAEIEARSMSHVELLNKYVKEVDALARWRAEVDPMLAAWRRRNLLDDKTA